VGQHTITYIKRSERDHTGRCACGWVPDIRRTYKTQQMVEDEVLKHLNLVERVRFHNAWGRTPSLLAQADYYAQRSEDPNESTEHRMLWRQLEVELRHRLGHIPTPEEAPELPL
jgi:hypothetical protein